MRMFERKTKIGLIQSACVGSTQENLEMCITRIREAASDGANIVVTHELFHLPYFCNSSEHANFALAETIPGPTTERLSQVARASGIVIAASIFERRAHGLYHSTVVVIDELGSLLGSYRRMHINEDKNHHDAFYFTPGDLGYQCFSTSFGKVGILIGWDQWYPEAARITSLAGAEILFIPNALSCRPGDSTYDAWETMLRSHAVANGIFVAVPNRAGLDVGLRDGDEFVGGSFVTSPSGEIVGKLDHSKQATLIVDCDWSSIDVQRTHWPFLRDRRIDAYRALTQRFI
jgi:N-carbamoylputrescine amidase